MQSAFEKKELFNQKQFWIVNGNNLLHKRFTNGVFFLIDFADAYIQESFFSPASSCFLDKNRKKKLTNKIWENKIIFSCYKIISKPALLTVNFFSEQRTTCLTREEFAANYQEPFMARASRLFPEKTIDFIIPTAIMICMKQMYRWINLAIAYQILKSKVHFLIS
jgi:hypothetical protein